MSAAAWYARGPRGAGVSSGAGAPPADSGDDGDFYVDTANGDTYKRSGGVWSKSGNIQGPTGRGFSGVTVDGDDLKFAGTDGVTDTVTVPALSDAAASAAAAAGSESAAAASAVAAAASASDAADSAAAAAAEGVVDGSVNGTVTSLTLWTGTAEQFAALESKDPTTVYVYPGGISIGGASVITTRTYAATVAVDHTKVGADLTDFPLYVDLADMPTAFWETVASGGGNIRCYAESTELAREVVSCDVAARTGELHVKTDLSSTADTVVTISVEGTSSEPGIASPYGARAVWSDYSLVSHDGGMTDVLGNVPNLSAWVQDPGSNPVTYTLTPNQYQLPQPSAGLLGSKGGSYYAAIDSGLRYEQGTKDVAQVSLWAKPTNVTSTSVIADLRRTNGKGQQVTISGQPFAVLITPNGGSLYTTTQFLNGVNVPGPTTGLPMTVNAWNYTVVQAQSSSGPGPIPLVLGQAYSSGFYFPGLIDEVRLCDVARSPEWIAAEYTNQLTPASFYTVT